MATFQRGYGTATEPSASDARHDRRLRIDWSALFGGTALGCGALVLFSLLGAAFGFSSLGAWGLRRASDAGSLAWGAGTLLVSSVFAAHTVVRLAGDRRRNESLLHGALSWALALIAFAPFAAGTVRTPELAAFGAMLSLAGALFGGLMGASRQSGVSLKDELRLGALGLQRPAHNGKTHPAQLHPPPVDDRRDETTILPPTH